MAIKKTFLIFVFFSILLSLNFVSSYQLLCLSRGQNATTITGQVIYTCGATLCQLCVTDLGYQANPNSCQALSCTYLNDSIPNNNNSTNSSSGQNSSENNTGSGGNSNNFISDIAYIVKDTSNLNTDFISVINELNYTYTLIDDNTIQTTNFSEYNMILIGDEPITNEEYVPITTKKSLVANTFYIKEWKLADYVGSISSGNSYLKGAFVENNTINEGLISPVQLYNAYNTPAYYLPKLPNR